MWNVTAAAPTVVYGVNLTVDKETKLTVAGVNATYELTVENTGNQPDNYTLSVDNPDNATVAELSTYTITNLAPGENYAVLLNVTNATVGVGTFRVNVTATSVSNTSVFDYVNTTTTIGATQTYTANETGEINATNIADTSVSYNTTTPVNITIGKYPANPGASFSGDIGKYIDVRVNDSANVTNLTIKLFYTDTELGDKIESLLKMYWWNGSAWDKCSYTGVNTIDQDSYGGYVWAFVNNTTTPRLSDLRSTPFGATAPAPAPAPTPTPRPRVAGGGGGGGTPRDTDGDGITDIEEMLQGTDPKDPCDPNPECAACKALMPATPAPTTAPIVSPTPKPTVKPTPVPTPAPATPTPTPKSIPGYEALFTIASLIAIAVVYAVVRRKK